MTQTRRLQAGVAILVLITFVGAVGYMIVEDLDAIDAFYTVVITISTVGFTEPPGGFTTAGKAFTVFVILAGVGSALYTASAGIELGVEAFLGGQRQRRRMEKQIAGLDGHIIVCGFGRVGRNVWQRLESAAEQPATLVIESDPDRVEVAREQGALVVEGDATRDEVLEAAGIARARTIIASVRHDADNLVIVLSARSKRKDLLIIARASEAESERKLLLAGADRVVAPQVVGALRLASMAVQPDVADFIDLMVEGRVVEFRVEQFVVANSSPAVGSTLAQSQIRTQTGTLVLAVQEGGRLALNPGSDFVIKPGQILYGIGTQEQVDRLRTVLCEAD